MQDQKDDFSQLMKFYGVNSIEELIKAQELHISRLQENAKRPTINQIMAQSPVRSA